ncbi:RelA/SpoT domain-containing protein [Agromyces atrinae]|uniref:RelA/SpoT domain-containing protein n=1 Tax=Agromyces atrinae TaxID=592376 RepID=UPI001F5AA739|nr:RelA/SpoT domain-containing protein [Agromyces atrinae]MCI2957314.1 RelA/SpoT domain-containing protein [Agromyces atrinae]
MTTTRTVPLHSKKAVRRAGEVIGNPTSSASDVASARDVVSNFRSSHGYPLIGITMHARQRALRVNPEAIVAQRLKRLPTIIDKLERHPRMNVTTMQDLGGCRVIFPTIAEVEQLVDTLESSTRAQNKIVRKYDYIGDEPGPKASGYRGIHLVYEYQASQAEFRGLRVELQIRTDLQHAWATAVETMDLFSGSEIKYDKADDAIRRFFAIVSSLMAVHEGTSLVPGAEAPVGELRAELAALDLNLGIISRLQGYAALVGRHAHSDRRSALTLELRRKEQELNVTVHETLAEAEARLAELESINDENLDVVLVGIAKVGQLQAAYPNYYANTTVFTDFVTELLR